MHRKTIMEYICKLSGEKGSIYHIDSMLEQMRELIRRKEKEGYRLIGCYQSDKIQQIKETLKSSTQGVLLDANSYNADVYAEITKIGTDITSKI